MKNPGLSGKGYMLKFIHLFKNYYLGISFIGIAAFVIVGKAVLQHVEEQVKNMGYQAWILLQRIRLHKDCIYIADMNPEDMRAGEKADSI